MNYTDIILGLRKVCWNVLVTHIYLNGRCKEAIEMYEKAFDATIDTIIEEPDKDNNTVVIHAEICIHGQQLMLNDNKSLDSEGYQLSVRFQNEEDLKKAYDILEEKSITVASMEATDYSTSVVRFIDKFKVRWGFWV